jgi:hypothetical protein
MSTGLEDSQFGSDAPNVVGLGFGAVTVVVVVTVVVNVGFVGFVGCVGCVGCVGFGGFGGFVLVGFAFSAL